VLRAEINSDTTLDFEASLIDLNKALEIDNDYKYALRLRASYHTALEKYDLAIDDYSVLLQDDDENIGLYYARALVYIANGDDDNAEKDLDNIIPGFEVNGEYIIDNVKLNKYIENGDTVIILHSLLEKAKIQFKKEEFFKSVELLIIINSIDSNYLEKLPDSTFPMAVNDKIASIYTKMCEDNGNAMLDFQKRPKLYIIYIKNWDKSKKSGSLCVPGRSGAEWFSIANDPNDSLFFLSLSSAQEYCKFIQSRYEGEIELEIKETKFTPSFWYIIREKGEVFASIRHDGYVNWTDINSAFEFMGTGKKIKNNQEVFETFINILQNNFGIHDVFIVGHK
jgi:tetratricopeptide (TPR) repeat protein